MRIEAAYDLASADIAISYQKQFGSTTNANLKSLPANPPVVLMFLFLVAQYVTVRQLDCNIRRSK